MADNPFNGIKTTNSSPANPYYGCVHDPIGLAERCPICQHIPSPINPEVEAKIKEQYGKNN